MDTNLLVLLIIMLNKYFLLVKRSTFLRLLVIFLLTAILLFALVGGVANYLTDSDRLIRNQIQTNLILYAEFLTQKIGLPPDYNIAQTLAQDYRIQIQIKEISKGKFWQSSTYNLPTRAMENKRQVTGKENINIGHYRGYFFIVNTVEGFEYTLSISHRPFADSRGLFLIFLILIIIIVIAISYLMVRWLFRPLRLLDEGVRQVGEGNFDFRVETHRKDELGELAQAFNHMSEKIQSMMKEKEQLLLDVSHELRSPMTRMKLALEFINEQQAKQSIQEDLLELERMITELLESARLNNPNSCLSKENVELNSFFSSILKLYADSSPGIEYIPSDNEIILFVDRHRLLICVRNIIENALKYSDNQHKAVVIDVHQTKEKTFITITDFGIGIPKKDQPHLFEPFYRVDKSRNSKTGGYGLGLNLCKNIVNAHGGEILLESVENKKTSLCLIFPNVVSSNN